MKYLFGMICLVALTVKGILEPFTVTLGFFRWCLAFVMLLILFATLFLSWMCQVPFGESFDIVLVGVAIITGASLVPPTYQCLRFSCSKKRIISSPWERAQVSWIPVNSITPEKLNVIPAPNEPFLCRKPSGEIIVERHGVESPEAYSFEGGEWTYNLSLASMAQSLHSLKP